jgi:hypothetical protein
LSGHAREKRDLFLLAPAFRRLVHQGGDGVLQIIPVLPHQLSSLLIRQKLPNACSESRVSTPSHQEPKKLEETKRERKDARMERHEDKEGEGKKIPSEAQITNTSSLAKSCTEI